MKANVALRLVLLGAASIALAACQTTPADRRSGGPAHLAEINTQLGIEYMRQGENETAMRKLEKALAADSNYAPAHDAMALLNARLGRPEEAERHFQRALALQPDSSGTLNNYGQFLCRQGRTAEGIALFDKAIANPLYATPEVAHANAGLCALQANDMETAETRFRAALKANPELPVALLQMARISYEQKNYLSARGYLQRYTEQANHTAQSLWLGVRIERELGDRDAESSYALTLRSNFPDSEETRQLLQSQSR